LKLDEPVKESKSNWKTRNFDEITGNIKLQSSKRNFFDQTKNSKPLLLAMVIKG
jgi:hypothetical protein